MLKFRICQNCGSRIDSPSALFCFNCGSLLTKPPSPSLEIPQKIFPAEAPANGKIRFHRRPSLFIWTLIFFVLILSLSAFLLRRWSAGDSRGGPTSVLLADFHFNADNELMEKPFFGEGVPERAAFYLSGWQIAAFFEKVLKSGALHFFEETTHLNLREAASYLEPGFAFFGEGGNFAFLGQVKSLDFTDRKVKEFNQSPPDTPFRPYLYGSYLLITDSSRLAGEVKEALEKKRLNLTLKASFAESWRLSPHRGQFFLYTAGHSDLQKILAFLFGPSSGPLLGNKIKGQTVLLSGSLEGTYLRGGIYGE